MALPSPRLDDRTFADLMEDARRLIRASCPGWTDLTPGDPGTTILEVFAYITEMMLYRVNRVPEKAYVEFLRLLGLTLTSPTAATVTLRFSRERPSDSPVNVPRGTRVTVGRESAGDDAPVFATSRAVTIEAGKSDVNVAAHSAEAVDGELVGIGTGMPGQTVHARRPPIVAPMEDGLDLVVGVETAAGELSERSRAVEYGGKAYRVWREVEHFIGLGEDRYVFIVDRMAGRVTFAPAARMTRADGVSDETVELEETSKALAETVPAGAEIRLWYRRGGGPDGNVGSDSLTTLKDPIPGLEVTNAQPATGGKEGESLENALKRGPQEIHSLRRTVTASDFELVAIRSSGAVARARAFTKAAMWAYAQPGTVEVLLVPGLVDTARVSHTQLVERQTNEAVEQIQQILDARRPLGTRCEVNWARYKTVAIEARVVVYREEDPEGVRTRVLERLHRLVNPLPTALGSAGWRFGEALRASHIFEMVLREPGVSYVDRLKMVVDEAPTSNVAAVAVDHHQEHTWYAGADEKIFRSVNDGAGWETAGQFKAEQIRWVGSHPQIPGLLAVVTRVKDDDKQRSVVHLSEDCGESWRRHARLGFRVHDAAWMLRNGQPVLLLASAVGLYGVSAMEPNPVQIQVVADEPADLGFDAVTVATDARGAVTVALGAEEKKGVYISSQGGQPNTFRHSGLKGRWIRALAVQHAGPIAFLWAGLTVHGPEDKGDGCSRLRLRGWADEEDTGTQNWQDFSRGWEGGSCVSLAVLEETVLAGTHRAGVLTLDASARDPDWKAAGLDCKLPLRDVGRFHTVESLEAAPGLFVVGGAEGVYCSRDGGEEYENCSGREFAETVTLPGSWLFCSGKHEVQVVGEDEVERSE